MREHFFVPDGISADAQRARADDIRREVRYTPRASTVHYHSFTDPCIDNDHDEYEIIEGNSR